jgi:hypothetical protein
MLDSHHLIAISKSGSEVSYHQDSYFLPLIGRIHIRNNFLYTEIENSYWMINFYDRDLLPPRQPPRVNCNQRHLSSTPFPSEPKESVTEAPFHLREHRNFQAECSEARDGAAHSSCTGEQHGSRRRTSQI